MMCYLHPYGQICHLMIKTINPQLHNNPKLTEKGIKSD
jgi:uncharacterized protein YneF (UPF0154 family)